MCISIRVTCSNPSTIPSTVMAGPPLEPPSFNDVASSVPTCTGPDGHREKYVRKDSGPCAFCWARRICRDLKESERDAVIGPVAASGHLGETRSATSAAGRCDHVVLR